jgi:hypothetical protein
MMAAQKWQSSSTKEQLMMDQNAFNIAIAIAGALGGWWMKAMWEAVKDLKVADERLATQVSDLKVLVAGDYVRREMFDRLSDAIFAKLDRIENKLDQKVDKE